ncbi:hypothetical protein ACQPXH_26145 [Nocardia sp. CA-135953]|uniref:hypothetical protein n=1 Tax=Nocardia sp. CA-135953 TaxID=3239978 RepID=UPI003D9609F3
MTSKPKTTAPQVNPIVAAAAASIRRKRPNLELHAPCRGQLSLFDPKEEDHDHNDQ